MAVERMKSCESVDELAKELGVTRRCLYKWRTKLEAVELGEEAARPSTHASAQRKEILQLKRLLAEKAMEVDFFEGCLAKSRGSTPAQQRWRESIYGLRKNSSNRLRLRVRSMLEAPR
jgi:transposase-like protein